MSDVEKLKVNGDILDIADIRMRNVVGGDEYDAVSGTYAVGDRCIYNNIMRECVTAVETPEAFDSEKWVNTTIDEVCSSLSSNLANYYSDSLTKNDGGNYINNEYTKIAYKYNLLKIIYLALSFKSITAGGSWKTIYTIPQAYVPLNNMSVMAISRDKKAIQVRVTSEGVVQFYSEDAIANNDLISCELVYI